MEKEKNVQQLTPDCILEINGKKFVRYATLLQLAENRGGLTRLDVEVIQFPNEANGNNAVCLARIEMDGRFTTDIGEASVKTLSPQVSDYLLSMASTRAKGRALRNILSVGICCLEEIGSFSEVISEESAPMVDERPVQTKSTTHSNTKSTDKPKAKNTNTEPKLITPAQEKAILGMANRQNIDPSQLCQEMFQTDLENLARKDASKIIEHLKAKAA